MDGSTTVKISNNTARLWAKVFKIHAHLALGHLPDDTIVIIPTNVDATRGLLEHGDIVSFFPKPLTHPDRHVGGIQAKLYGWDPKLIARRFSPKGEAT